MVMVSFPQIFMFSMIHCVVQFINARELDGRVNIGNNCDAVLHDGKPFTEDAVGLKTVIADLKRTDINAVCLYSSLDTIKTFASTLPKQRDSIAKYCDGTSEKSNWLAAVGGVELCFLYTSEFQPKGISTEGMAALTIMSGGNKEKTYQFDTKTEMAKPCFNKIKSITSLRLPVPETDIIKAAQAAQTSLEDQYFKDLMNPKRPYGLLVVAKRVQGTVSNPKLNQNFDIMAVFFSPNDADKRLHNILLGGLLTQEDLNHIVKKPEVDLKTLIEKFPYQAIIINEKLDSTMLEVIKKAAATTAASLITQNKPAETGFKEFPQDWILFMRERPETSKNKFPLVVLPQLLIIGKLIPELAARGEGAPHVLSVLDAKKLLNGPAAPTTSKQVSIKPVAPSREGEWYDGDLEKTIKQIINENPSQKYQSVVLDISDTWHPADKVKLERDIGIGVIIPTGIGTPTDYSKTSIYITNKKKNFNIMRSKPKFTTLYDTSVYATKEFSFGKYLQKEATAPSNPKLIEASTNALMSNPLDSEASYDKLAEKIKQGGIESVTFQKGTIRGKDFYKGDKLAKLLSTKYGIPSVDYAGKPTKDKVFLIHEKGFVDPNYLYHWGFIKAGKEEAQIKM